MYRLAKFIKRYSTLFLFIVLEAAAIGFYAHATSYTRATLLRTASQVTGGVSSLLTSAGRYLSLGRDNRVLLERLAGVETELSAARAALYAADSVGVDASYEQKYSYTPARVISNSIARQDNFFVIDKGTRDGIEENMAVLSANGSVAGYVRSCSDRYAVCMSILNRGFSIGGRLQGSDYFGSVQWDGTDPRVMTMLDIPRYAPVAVGDSVLSAYSLRFPSDCFIGTVASVKESDDGTAYILKIATGARMNALSDVILVKFSDYDELNTLAGEYFNDASPD